MMYLFGQSVEVPRKGQTRVTFTIPEGAPAFSLPRRILVDEEPLVGCTYQVKVRGLKVDTAGFVKHKKTDLLNGDLDHLWPAVAPGDTVVVDISNPGRKKTRIGLSLFLIGDPACYKRLEQTTPLLTAEDGAYTLVLHVLDSGLIRRLEFETREEWGPAGWNVEAIDVASYPQLMVSPIPVGYIAGAPEGAMRFPTAMVGTEIAVKVKRTSVGPAEALTVRAVLNPVRRDVERALEENRGMGTKHCPPGHEDEEPWFEGFDDGFEGNPPESPDELYLEGYCDGVLANEEDD
jgi:hypothetical protein